MAPRKKTQCDSARCDSQAVTFFPDLIYSKFLQYVSLSLSLSGNLWSPGVASGFLFFLLFRKLAYFFLCLLKIWCFHRVIIRCTLQSGAAAPGDQSISNEGPRDPQEIDCSPQPLSLIQVLITLLPQESMMYARKCLDPFPSVGVYTSQTSLVFFPSLSHLSPFYCLIKKKVEGQNWNWKKLRSEEGKRKRKKTWGGKSGSIKVEVKWFMNSILTCGQRPQVEMRAFNWPRLKSNSAKSLMKPDGIYRQPN